VVIENNSGYEKMVSEQLYFRCRIADQHKEWASHVCSSVCALVVGTYWMWNDKL